MPSSSADPWESSETDDLLEAILSLQNGREARSFFRDLLTDKEIAEFGKRWKAARMLAEEIPYSTIVEVTGLSTTTVARISKWLQQGAGGYRLMLKRLEK